MLEQKKSSSYPLSNLCFSYASKPAISTLQKTHVETRRVVTVLQSGLKFTLNTPSHCMSLASSSTVWEAQAAWLPFYSVLPSPCLSLQVGGCFLSLSFAVQGITHRDPNALVCMKNHLHGLFSVLQLILFCLKGQNTLFLGRSKDQLFSNIQYCKNTSYCKAQQLITTFQDEGHWFCIAPFMGCSGHGSRDNPVTSCKTAGTQMGKMTTWNKGREMMKDISIAFQETNCERGRKSVEEPSVLSLETSYDWTCFLQLFFTKSWKRVDGSHSDWETRFQKSSLQSATQWMVQSAVNFTLFVYSGLFHKNHLEEAITSINETRNKESLVLRY